MTHAELSLDIPAAAWGRLAAVYRTLEWVSHSADRSQIAPFVGVNCGRLMDEALPLIALGDERQAELLRARALLAGLDARPDPEREGVVNTLRGIFESIIPLSQLGASIPMLQKKGELITPPVADGADGGRVGQAEQEAQPTEGSLKALRGSARDTGRAGCRGADAGGR